MYLWLKFIHVTCVALSLSGFVARGVLMLRESPLLEHRVTRRLPHVIDSLLLASALGLAWTIHQYPIVDTWLTAKVLGLLTYIGLGTVALRRGRTRRVRLAAWLGAIAVFAYIVGVALTHSASWGCA